MRGDVIMATGRSRLPEPGQQRARLPVHLPRRARRARAQDQRGDEDGRRAGARRARAQASRPARDGARTPTAGERFDVRPDYIIPKPFDPRVLICGSHRRWPRRRWSPASRACASTSTSTANGSRRGLGSSREFMRTRDQQGQERAAAHRLPRGRRRSACCAPCRSCARRGSAQPDPARQRGRDPRRTAEVGVDARRRHDHRPPGSELARRYRNELVSLRGARA